MVETGRRDGMISRAEDVKLPSPFGSVAQSISAFAAKKFTTQEMVALFGILLGPCNLLIPPNLFIKCLRLRSKFQT